MSDTVAAQEHLPDCLISGPVHPDDVICICDRLRACEARVREEEQVAQTIAVADAEARVLNEYRQQHDGISERYFQQVRNDALDAAEEAVAACKTHVRRRNVARHSDWFAGRTNWYAIKFTTVDRDDALAAIAALKGEQK